MMMKVFTLQFSQDSLEIAYQQSISLKIISSNKLFIIQSILIVILMVLQYSVIPDGLVYILPICLGGFLLLIVAISHKFYPEIISWIIMGYSIIISVFFVSIGYENKVKMSLSDRLYTIIACMLMNFLYIENLQSWIKQGFYLLSSLISCYISMSEDYDNPTAEITIVIIFLFCLFYFYSKEKRQRQAFYHIYTAQYELKEFKNLLDKHIPQAIIVINPNLKDVIFYNEAAKKDFSIENKEDILNLMNFITITKEQFGMNNTINKESGNNNQSSNNEDHHHNYNLINFIKSFQNEILLKTEINLHECDIFFKNEAKKIDLRIQQVTWENKAMLAFILYDVTQRHLIYKLKAATKYKDRVLASFSHELRTPLNGIFGFLYMLDQKINNMEEKKCVSLCLNCAKLLMSLVNSVLDLSSLRSNELIISFRSIKIRNLINDIISLFAFQAKDRGLQIILEIDDNVPELIFTDKNRLEQILINILGNAFKFTFHGSIALKIKKDHEFLNSLCFEIIDTGIGMDQEITSSLFCFADKEAHDCKNGAGIGLTISNSLVKALAEHEDKRGIIVYSEIGKGSKFIFNISSNLKEFRKIDSNGVINRIEFKDHIQDPNMFFQEANYFCENLTNFKDKDLDENVIINPDEEHLLIPSIKSQKKSLINLDSSKNFYSNNTNQSQLKKLQKNITQILDNKPDEIKLSNHKSLSIDINLGTLLTERKPEKTICQTEKKIPDKILLHKNPSDLHVMIVDDNPFNLMILDTMLKKQGITCIKAYNGKSALDLIIGSIERISISLIFMDLQMPIMDGFEATERLNELFEKKNIPKIPIVALTANDGSIERFKAMKLGMGEFLVKPIDEKTLTASLNKWIFSSS